MTLEEIKTRKAEIKASLEADGEVDVNALRSEIESLEVEERALIENAKAEAEANEIRKAEAEAEERRKMADAIEVGEVRANEIIPQEVKKMEEIRNTLEYRKAFVKAIMNGDDAECRALLTENVSGDVPVPQVLETEIRNAWEESTILSHAKKTYYTGNVVVGFEKSATEAVVHTEGTEAPTQEVLTIGKVELKAESIKKWITISDEAIDNTTIDTLGYIYKELAQKIVEKAEEIAIGKIVACPVASTSTAVAVPVLTANAVAIDTMVKANALLGGQAKNLFLIMNRQTRADFMSVALNNKYGADPFDGLKDRILFTDALKPFANATTGDTYAIVGDLGALQVNFPRGEELQIKTDDMSLAEADLVKVVGRMFVGMGVVAPKHFVKINK